VLPVDYPKGLLALLGAAAAGFAMLGRRSPTDIV
jgi:hypothetical protein